LIKPAVLLTDATWKCEIGSHTGWESPGFDDRAWSHAIPLGGIEEKSDFFDNNEDAGMYRWPGYDGISPYLAHAVLKAGELTYGFEGMGKFSNTSALLGGDFPGFAPQPRTSTHESSAATGEKNLPRSREFAASLPAGRLPPSEY